MDKELMALREIVAVMGPKVPSCCQGCEWEWGEALRIATAAIAQREPGAESQWRTMESAPRDGSAFLAYGIHTDSPKDAQQGVEAGHSWWAIILYDVYREVGMGGSQFVFAKDGARTWSAPKYWMPLPAAPEAT